MAVKRGVKKKEGERLDDKSVQTAIAMREREKPATIKETCEFLNINPNGARLTKIFEEYRDRVALEKKLRAANRGKPAQDFEIKTIIEEFLTGETLKAISEQLYRPVAFVKQIIEDVGVPQVEAGETYASFGPLPEQCIAETFELGEFVWSSKYVAIAEIDKDQGMSGDGTARIYRIFIHQHLDPDKMLIDGKRYSVQPESGGGFYANQRAYDLGSLKHLLKYGIDLKRAIK